MSMQRWLREQAEHEAKWEGAAEMTMEAVLTQLKKNKDKQWGFTDEPLPKLLSSHDIHGMANLIKSDKCKNISVLAGAGISVSAGIPDFRSKGGFYNSLNFDNYPLTDPQKAKCTENREYILSLELFKLNPSVYLTARRDMILAATKYYATLSHWFIRLLCDKGKLRRYFTTNIDGLDYQLGLPEDKMITVHGNIGKAVCIECKEFVDMDWFRSQVAKQDENGYVPAVYCPKDKCNGYVKPNTILFGESLPDRYDELINKGNDLENLDLFIVIGSSLAVGPTNYLPQKVDFNTCARLLINRDKTQLRFDSDDEKSNDIWLKGNCDDSIRELVKTLGWENDLYNLLPQTLKDKERGLLVPHMEEKKEDNKMSDKEELIQSLIGGNTSFLNKSQINRMWTASFKGVTFRTLILPVIFVQDPTRNSFDTVWKSVNHNIHLVLKYNFDGIILTNHGFMCKDLIQIIEKVRIEYPKLWIGVNFLGCIGDELEYLINKKLLNKVNGLWIENCGISFANDSDEIIKHRQASNRLVNYRKIQSEWMNGNGVIFGGIEFNNGKTFDNNYEKICKKLASFSAKGFMHCICVSSAGDYGLNKIECFKNGINSKCKLCISHGVTAENVKEFLNGCDAIFLNKGLSDADNFFHFNEFKMSKFRNVIQSYYDSVEPDSDNNANKKTPGLQPVLSPVDEEPENKTSFLYDNEEEEILYQIYIQNANDINEDLNGIYKVITNENELPSTKHKSDSVFTPNFMYYLKSFKTQCEYGIFIIPSLESMEIYKPTWVIGQINIKKNIKKNEAQQPTYYYACQVDFKQPNALTIPPQIINGNWLIVGDDGTSQITMQLQVLTLKKFAERRRNFSAMFSKTNKEKMRHAIEETKVETKVELKEENKTENKTDLQIFDADDTKVTCVEMVGINNILRVTNDINELKREWNECELGEHDELEMFLGVKGKVIDIEEDDDTVQLEWVNYDYHWIPVKACWLTWRDRNTTQPMYSNQEDVDGDSIVVNHAFGGNIKQ